MKDKGFSSTTATVDITGEAYIFAFNGDKYSTFKLEQAGNWTEMKQKST